MPAPKAKMHHLLALVLACRADLDKSRIPDPEDDGKFWFAKKHGMYIDSVQWLVDNEYLSQDDHNIISVSDKGIVAMELVLTYFHRVNTNILNEQNLEMSIDSLRNVQETVVGNPSNRRPLKDKDKERIVKESL